MNAPRAKILSAAGSRKGSSETVNRPMKPLSVGEAAMFSEIGQRGKGSSQSRSRKPTVGDCEVLKRMPVKLKQSNEMA